MQYLNIKVSSDISSNIQKIDQLLRLYQTCKKTDLSKKSLVQSKINSLLEMIKSDKIYPNIEEFLKKHIQAGIQDPKIVPKVQRNLSGTSGNKSSNPSISVEKVRFVSDASISNNNQISSEEHSKNNLQKIQSMKSVQLGDSSNSNPKPSLVNISPMKSEIFSAQSSSQVSYEKSQKSDDNCYELMIDNLNQFCQEFKSNIQTGLAINQDIFTSIKQSDDKNVIYLFGINNPEKKNMKKLYICTLMKFLFQQIQNIQVQTKFNKQWKVFQNNLRSPIGLIIPGSSTQDIKIQHLKFLLSMKSPLPLIIIMESFKDRKGKMFVFNDKALVKNIKYLNKVEYAQKIAEIRTNYADKGVELSALQVIKDKLIITKNLQRSITSNIESAQNAIQIQSSNQCIKEQPSRFPYKLHTKFYVSPKSDYQLFFLDNQILAYKVSYKEKEFDAFKKYVLEQAQHKAKLGGFILSTSVLKQTSEIKKDFLKLLIESKLRDPYFIVNFSGINNKKTLILTIKETVSEAEMQSYPTILFKDMESPHELFNLIAAVDKKNFRNFETENKVEVTDLSQKKK